MKPVEKEKMKEKKKKEKKKKKKEKEKKKKKKKKQRQLLSPDLVSFECATDEFTTTCFHSV